MAPMTSGMLVLLYNVREKKNHCSKMFPLCPTITVLLASLSNYNQTNDML